MKLLGCPIYEKIVGVDIEHVRSLLEVPVISLLEASNIRVLQSDSIIHVLIAYPKIKTICKKVTIFPVSHHPAVEGEHSS